MKELPMLYLENYTHRATEPVLPRNHFRMRIIFENDNKGYVSFFDVPARWPNSKQTDVRAEPRATIVAFLNSEIKNNESIYKKISQIKNIAIELRPKHYQIALEWGSNLTSLTEDADLPVVCKAFEDKISRQTSSSICSFSCWPLTNINIGLELSPETTYTTKPLGASLKMKQSPV